MDTVDKLYDEQLVAALKALDEAWPFKRVVVPKHLLDEFNEGRKEQTVQMAFTVAKDVEVTEEMIRDFMSKMDAIRASATPLDFGDATRDANGAPILKRSDDQ